MYLKIYTLSLSSLIIVHNTIKEGASMKVVYILMLWFGKLLCYGRTILFF
jgi:hypothetical protein